ncbi:nucleotidyl transferase AbiEii/AbiGii toxin family protein [Candidatus Poriferisodalis sp.]|uniref:nucleotidyl transferase AbiEii/AbiGii toxin family protein n=1 Tax=Candidatus Poriferisodalis sp. TaxID=3101277 RepID=UPI003B0143CD
MAPEHHSVDGTRVDVEFICETDQVPPGRIHRLKQGTGSGFAAFNARCAGLTSQDNVEVPVTAERLDAGGLSTVTLRVAGVLTFTALKVLAFQDRHHSKDSYDLVYTLNNYENGPKAAGEVAAQSPVRSETSVAEALGVLRERFESPDHDGPAAYANFMADRDDQEHKARLRNEAVAVVRQFLSSAGA